MRGWACLLLLVAGVGVPSALAKGPDTARICGVSGCATVDAVAEVNALALYTSGFEARSEPAAAPFFTVELSSSIHGSGADAWSFLYVPSARALKIVRADFSGGVYGEQTTNSWVSLSDEAVAAYERATPVVSPFPANSEWVVATTPDEREVPWLALAFVVAAVIAATSLFVARRVLARRATQVAHD